MLEFLESLIKEWYVADLRRRIYRSDSDKQYWTKVCSYKKKKIEDITSRNHLPSIFGDTDTRSKYNRLFYPEDKLPVIILNDKDLRYYFSRNCDVILLNGSGGEFGVIKDSDFDSQTLTVELKDGNTKPVPFSQARRIV